GEADLVGQWLPEQGQALHHQLPLEGRHNARNLLLALAVARQLGVSFAQLQQMDVAVPGGRNRRLQPGCGPG
ncbi:MAG: UDP-N-acetylmuramyl peptide synthase, partial [Vulcanococcus sp.]